MTIQALYDRVKSVDTSAIAVETIKETSPERIELNREQLQSGLRSDGSDILPSYSPLTIQIKKLKGQETRFVNLLDTGAFQKAITSNVTGQSIITESTDWKNEKLKKKYETSKGKLFGLGGDMKQEYIDKTLRPVFTGKLSKAFGLKFK